MSYLVTGGTGSMGVYVVRDLLNMGKEVVCLQRSGVTPYFRRVLSEEDISKVKVIQGDVSNTLLVFNAIKQNNVDTVIHLSSIIASGGISESQPTYTLQVNCIGTNNIFEAGRLFGLKKIVWTSSSQAFGAIGKYYKQPIGDDAIYMPDTMYGTTKVLNDFMTKLYYEKFGVDIIGFRLGLILSVDKNMGRGGSFTKFLKDVAMDVPTTMATMDADAIRPLGYVENISDLLIKACEVPSPKTRVFNAIEFPVSCRQIAESIQKVNPQAKITIKDGVSSEEATWGGAQEPLLDASGIREELKWQPKYSLDEAMKKVLNHFRKQADMPML